MLTEKNWREVASAGTVLAVMLLSVGSAHAAVYTVKGDGSGSFLTIQACANAAGAGDSCVVYAGNYPEHVKTAAGGTSDSARVTFRAQGTVTTQGFEIRHPYVTVDGFDITGYGVLYEGLITIYSAGHYCRIWNNRIHDGLANVYGIYFYTSSGQAAGNCDVRGNRLSNLAATFITTSGDHHVFDSNILEYQNNMDYLRLFGSNHVFRRNVFWKGTTQSTSGNHPDFVQTFGASDVQSQNHVFEQNWIQDLPSQFGQLNSGDGVVTKGILYNNVKNVLFRQNIIINVSMNANISMPGVRFENNTFYRMAYALSGLIYGGSLSRGDSSNGLLKNNIFLAGGSTATAANDSSGFYFASGIVMSREVIGIFVTSDPNVANPVTSGIYDNLRDNGYIDPNGKILSKAAALTDISQFMLSSAYGTYKTAVYNTLMSTVQLDATMRATFLADYNFVAGAESAGFPGKRSSGCDPLKTFTDWNFCEPHGINGGDPKLANLASPLGPDGIPFTLDDGLKPVATSPLCGKGEGGSDIGAYSCDPTKVFSAPAPSAPTNVKIIKM